MNTVVSIVSGTSADAAKLPRVIADAYEPVDVSRWLVPTPSPWLRIGVLSRYAQILVSHALTFGKVFTTPDRVGAAVLLRHGQGPRAEATDYDRQLRSACAEHTHRFRTLDGILECPLSEAADFWHLALLAITPRQQGRGLGTALLEHCHSALPGPFYVTASSPQAELFYADHGYEALDAVSLPGGGPALARMWRGPSAGQGGAR